jgi:hypothetical protein
MSCTSSIRVDTHDAHTHIHAQHTPLFSFRSSYLTRPQYISMKLSSQWYFGRARKMCPLDLISVLIAGSLFSSSWKSGCDHKARRRQQYSGVSFVSSGRVRPATVSHRPLHCTSRALSVGFAPGSLPLSPTSPRS